jgi:hypothetical protein
LFEIIHEAGVQAGLSQGFLTLLESRSEITELLSCHESVDLIIPRGSNEFVRYIMDHSEIPVMGHSDGICHVYVDKAADIEKAVSIILDSKTQYVAACNTAETVLVHEAIAKAVLPKLQESLHEKNVQIHATKPVQDILADAKVGSDAGTGGGVAAGAPASNVRTAPASEDDFRTEYLDYIVSMKIVEDIDEAIFHINVFGSHHTDAIVTEDGEAAGRFFAGVDSAGVYRNCSTRFADGYRYGFGAEVGISTGKLHARGPVGLDGLVNDFKQDAVAKLGLTSPFENGAIPAFQAKRSNLHEGVWPRFKDHPNHPDRAGHLRQQQIGVQLAFEQYPPKRVGQTDHLPHARDRIRQFLLPKIQPFHNRLRQPGLPRRLQILIIFNSNIRAPRPQSIRHPRQRRIARFRSHRSQKPAVDLSSPRPIHRSITHNHPPFPPYNFCQIQFSAQLFCQTPFPA